MNKGDNVTLMQEIAGKLVSIDFVFLGKKLVFNGVDYFAFQAQTKSRFLTYLSLDALKTAMPSETVECDAIPGL
tara:strand:+ start:298 stop:519 length:222 start_codon:yes stop_codon:yes gene_type:complete